VVVAGRVVIWVPTLVIMLSTAEAEAVVVPIPIQSMLAREAHHSMPLVAVVVVAKLAAVIQTVEQAALGEVIPQAEVERLV